MKEPQNECVPGGMQRESSLGVATRIYKEISTGILSRTWRKISEEFCGESPGGATEELFEGILG